MMLLVKHNSKPIDIMFYKNVLPKEFLYVWMTYVNPKPKIKKSTCCEVESVTDYLNLNSPFLNGKKSIFDLG